MSDAAAPRAGLLRRILRPAVALLDRRIAQHTQPVQANIDTVSDSITKVYADLLEATTDVRRWLADDLDANTETAALVGRSLTRLSDAVDRLGDEVADLGQRLAKIEAQLAGAPLDAGTAAE
jgi:ubiquinone biosynthesis protein UbiJ